MKKKILMSVFAIMVLALGVFAYTFTANTTTAKAASCSCCKADSCPMKKGSMNADAKTSCPDGCDSCTADSCPMKKKDSAATTTETSMTAATGEAKTCDCSCCNHDKNKETGKATDPQI